MFASHFLLPLWKVTAVIEAVNELSEISFPLLEKEGWLRRSADGVVGSGKSTRSDHPGLRPPLVFKEGKFAACNSFTPS
jgi:hypothetical protein